MPRLDRAAWYVRIGYHLPLVDRFVYEWMWHHGAWDVVTSPGEDGAERYTGPGPRPDSGGSPNFAGLPESGEGATATWTWTPRRRTSGSR